MEYLGPRRIFPKSICGASGVLSTTTFRGLGRSCAAI